MLNLTQRHVLKSFFDESIFELELFCCVTGLHPREVIAVLQALLDGRAVTTEMMDQIRSTDLREIIKQILDIQRHECPQNRTASSVQVPQNEAGIDLGYVYFRNDGCSDLQREKRGLFGLSARNDASCQPVERSDVLYFVRERIEQELRTQQARLSDFGKMEAAEAALTKQREEKKHLQDVQNIIMNAVRESRTSDAVTFVVQQLDSADEQQILRLADETIQHAQAALTQGSIVNHVLGNQEQSLEQLKMLRSLAGGEAAASLEQYFSTQRLLHADTDQLDIDEIVRALDGLQDSEVRIRVQLTLQLAKAQEFSGQHEAAASSLLKVLGMIPESSNEETVALTLDVYRRLVDARVSSCDALDEVTTLLVQRRCTLALHQQLKPKAALGLQDYEFTQDELESMLIVINAKEDQIDAERRFDAFIWCCLSFSMAYINKIELLGLMTASRHTSSQKIMDACDRCFCLSDKFERFVEDLAGMVQTREDDQLARALHFLGLRKQNEPMIRKAMALGWSKSKCLLALSNLAQHDDPVKSFRHVVDALCCADINSNEMSQARILLAIHLDAIRSHQQQFEPTTDINGIKCAVDMLQGHHDIKGRLMVVLALLQERSGDADHAALQTLVEALDLLPEKIMANLTWDIYSRLLQSCVADSERFIAVTERLAAADPPSPLACHQQLKRMEQQGIPIVHVHRSKVLAVLTCEQLGVDKCSDALLWFCRLDHCRVLPHGLALDAHLRRIFENAQASTYASKLLDIIEACYSNTTFTANQNIVSFNFFLHKLLSSATSVHAPRASFLLGVINRSQQHLTRARELGWDSLECMAHLAQLYSGNNRQESLKLAVEILAGATNPNTIFVALRAVCINNGESQHVYDMYDSYFGCVVGNVHLRHKSTLQQYYCRLLCHQHRFTDSLLVCSDFLDWVQKSSYCSSENLDPAVKQIYLQEVNSLLSNLISNAFSNQRLDVADQALNMLVDTDDLISMLHVLFEYVQGRIDCALNSELELRQLLARTKQFARLYENLAPALQTTHHDEQNLWSLFVRLVESYVLLRLGDLDAADFIVRQVTDQLHACSLEERNQSLFSRLCSMAAVLNGVLYRRKKNNAKALAQFEALFDQVRNSKDTFQRESDIYSIYVTEYLDLLLAQGNMDGARKVFTAPAFQGLKALSTDIFVNQSRIYGMFSYATYKMTQEVAFVREAIGYLCQIVQDSKQQEKDALLLAKYCLESKSFLFCARARDILESCATQSAEIVVSLIKLYIMEGQMAAQDSKNAAKLSLDSAKRLVHEKLLIEFPDQQSQSKKLNKQIDKEMKSLM